MLTPLVRIVADWLKHQDNGVNAMLATKVQPQVESEDGIVPAIRGIYDETRDDWVTERVAPTDPECYPLITVQTQNARRLDGRATHVTQDGVYDIVCEYITRDSKPARAKQRAYDTLRAVLLSLTALGDPRIAPINQAPRRRGQVELNVIENPEYIPTFDQFEGGGYLAGAVLVEVHARDFLVTS